MAIKRPVVPVSADALAAQLLASRCNSVPQLDDPTSFIAALARNYPRSALNEAGWVAVRFDVLASGAADNVAILDSEPTTMFDAAAQAIMRDLRFTNREDTCMDQVTILRFLPQAIPGR